MFTVYVQETTIHAFLKMNVSAQRRHQLDPNVHCDVLIRTLLIYWYALDGCFLWGCVQVYMYMCTCIYEYICIRISINGHTMPRRCSGVIFVVSTMAIKYLNLNLVDTVLDNKPRLFMTLCVLIFYMQSPKGAQGWIFYINIMWSTGFLTEGTLAVLSFVWPGVTNEPSIRHHPCIGI